MIQYFFDVYAARDAADVCGCLAELLCGELYGAEALVEVEGLEAVEVAHAGGEQLAVALAEDEGVLGVEALEDALDGGGDPGEQVLDALAGAARDEHDVLGGHVAVAQHLAAELVGVDGGGQVDLVDHDEVALVGDLVEEGLVVVVVALVVVVVEERRVVVVVEQQPVVVVVEQHFIVFMII